MVCLTVKTQVVVTVPPVPTPSPAVQTQLEIPVIAGVLCGILLLLALPAAVLCFTRKGYSKFR